MQQQQTSLEAHWWSVYNTDTLTVEETASLGLNVMMTPCWENHERDAAVSWTAIKQVFIVGSIVALWGLMTSKQSHDGLLLPFYPTKIPFYTNCPD